MVNYHSTYKHNTNYCYHWLAGNWSHTRLVYYIVHSLLVTVSNITTEITFFGVRFIQLEWNPWHEVMATWLFSSVRQIQCVLQRQLRYVCVFVKAGLQRLKCTKSCYWNENTTFKVFPKRHLLDQLQSEYNPNTTNYSQFQRLWEVVSRSKFVQSPVYRFWHPLKLNLCHTVTNYFIFLKALTFEYCH